MALGWKSRGGHGGRGLRLFRWLSARDIPPDIDLRRCGWSVTSPHKNSDACVLIAHYANMEAASWVRLLNVHEAETRRRILLLGVCDDDERARLLRLGFGEVLGDRLSLAELEVRAMRVAKHADMLPRHRDLGRLRLDLLARDGFADKRPLGLHPREFALIWRLADMPGVPASKAMLLSDVWRLGHIPETNSLAVHVSRLRTKLALAGLDGLVQTAPSGGYLLAPSNGADPAPIPLITLDSHIRFSEDAGPAIRECRYET